MKKSDIFWQTYLSLEKEAIEVSRYIFITDEKIENVKGEEIRKHDKTQLNVYSPRIADLLIRCCVQIEAISKELYYDNGGEKKRGDNSIFFDEDCLKLIDKKWETHKKKVLVTNSYFNLTKKENTILRPLKEAHKRKGTYWERAYQAVKHDRYSSMYMGNVKAFIQALAALYLLNLYYRKDSWIVNVNEVHNANFSMGSALFSVIPPEKGQLWYGNNPVNSESPYVVKYVESDYKQIEELQQKGNQAINRYIISQPELNEEGFVRQLLAAAKKAEEDPKQRVMVIWEITKYRMNKKIPSSLPFDEKKKRLLNSREYNGFIYQNNSHLKPEELTENNIQKEIEKVAICWGMEIEKEKGLLHWLPTALNSANCRIFIPD